MPGRSRCRWSAALSPEPLPVGRRAAGGGFWVLSGTLAGGATTTLVVLILAGILTPTEFGAVAVAMIVLEAGSVGLSPGLGQAVQALPRDASTDRAALGLALVAGMAVAVLFGPLIPLFVGLLGMPQSAPLAAAILVSLPARRWNEVRIAQFERELRFTIPSVTVALSTIAAGALAIVSALAGAGAWALVIQVVASEIFTAIALTLRGPGPRAPRLQKAPVQRIWRFSRQVLGSSLAVFGYTNLDDAVVARVAGAASLGAYSFAYRVVNIAILLITRPVQRVLLPALRAVSDSGGSTADAYLRTLRVLTWMSGALTTVIALYGPAVLEVLYGGRWAESYGPIRILCIYAAFRALGASAGTVFLAFDLPNLVRKIASWQLVGLVLIIVPSIRLWGVTGAAVAVTLPLGVGVVVALSKAARITGATAVELGRTVLGLWALALGIGLIGLSLSWVIPGLVGLAVSISSAATLLGLLTWRIALPEVRRLRQ